MEKFKIHLRVAFHCNGWSSSYQNPRERNKTSTSVPHLFCTFFKKKHKMPKSERPLPISAYCPVNCKTHTSENPNKHSAQAIFTFCSSHFHFLLKPFSLSITCDWQEDQKGNYIKPHLSMVPVGSNNWNQRPLSDCYAALFKCTERYALAEDLPSNSFWNGEFQLLSWKSSSPYSWGLGYLKRKC